jgi:hypothetical protein
MSRKLNRYVNPSISLGGAQHSFDDALVAGASANVA